MKLLAGVKAVRREVGEIREETERRETKEPEVEAAVRRELEAVEGGEEEDPGIVPAPVLAGRGETEQLGPVGLEVSQELRPGLGSPRGDAGTESSGEELAGHWPVQGGLDQRGVGRGDHGYQDVGDLYEEVQSSPQVLPELSPVGGAGAGEVAEVRVATGDQHQLGNTT